MGALKLPVFGTVYADAQVLIYTVERRPVYSEVLAALWEAVDAGRLEVATSELTILESLVVPLRRKDNALIAQYEGFLQTGTRLLPMTQSVLRHAAELRARTSLRTPDAIHAATALLGPCALFLTNDRAFRQVRELNVAVLDDCL